MNNYRKQRDNICDMLRGNINRMCVTDDKKELIDMYNYAIKRIEKLFDLNADRLERLKENPQRFVGEWVPCNNLMPERNKMVMITYGNSKKKNVGFLMDLNEENKKRLNVIAWMEMPKPYKQTNCVGCFGASNNDCVECEKNK